MKSGRVKSQIGKFLLYGAPGTGKTSFMDMIIGNSPATIRRSTPLAVRPVAIYQVDMTNNTEWVKLSDEKKKQLVMRAAIGTKTESQEDSDSEESEAETASVNQGSVNPKRTSFTDDSSRPHPVAMSTSTADTSVKHHVQSSSTCDDLVKLIEECSRTGKIVTFYHKFHFIDSGGQPQFHEILPAFLRRMTLYMFVFKLSDELATKPMVEYYDNSGNAVGTPYQSPHTNEQLLKYCLQTLRSHRTFSKTDNGNSKIMIIGTHRDKEAECTTETREEKNERLAELLLPSFKGEVVYSLPNNGFIFAVNAKNPEEQDKALIGDVRKLIMTKCCPSLLMFLYDIMLWSWF